MKKTLIALAAVAATGAAFAQSSVTLYGVADGAIGKVNKAGPAVAQGAVQGNPFGGATTPFTNTSAQFLSSSSLNNGTSRWGIRGTEDLGGGLKATFNMEAGFDLDSGMGNYSGGQMFSRAANLGLSGGFGTILVGRALTPSLQGVAAYELTGTANYSALAAQFGFAGAGSRNSSQVAYTTPTFGGLTAHIGTILKGDTTTGNSKMDLGVVYKGGPISAGFSYNKTKGAEKNWALGASYNLGIATVAASYQDPAGASKGFTVGASAPMGPVTLTFDVARVTSGVKETDYILEAKYALSKRTFAYTALLRDGGSKTNGFGVGVRHNF